MQFQEYAYFSMVFDRGMSSSFSCMTNELPMVDINTAITVSAAKEAGWHAMTLPYNLPYEMEMMQRVIRDLIKRSCRYVLVSEKRGVAIWRK